MIPATPFAIELACNADRQNRAWEIANRYREMIMVGPGTTPHIRKVPA